MLAADIFTVASLTLYSLYDLRYRVAPLIEILFFGAVLLAALADPVKAILIILALGWSLLFWRQAFAVALLIFPPVWLVLVTGYGYRQEVVGRPDVFAAAALALLFPFPAVICSAVGLELWRRWWVRRKLGGPVPAIPGMLLGILVYFLVRLVLL